MTKTLKRSIGITFILILISALSGGGITLGMAVFSGHYIFSGIFFLLYILLFLIALIYSSSNVIFALPCKKFLRTLFFVLWLILYSVLSYCLLFAWIFLGFRFSDICWNINYLMNHCLNSVAILMIPLKWFWVFLKSVKIKVLFVSAWLLTKMQFYILPRSWWKIKNRWPFFQVWQKFCEVFFTKLLHKGFFASGKIKIRSDIMIFKGNNSRKGTIPNNKK